VVLARWHALLFRAAARVALAATLAKAARAAATAVGAGVLAADQRDAGVRNATEGIAANRVLISGEGTTRPGRGAAKALSRIDARVVAHGQPRGTAARPSLTRLAGRAVGVAATRGAGAAAIPLAAWAFAFTRDRVLRCPRRATDGALALAGVRVAGLGAGAGFRLAGIVHAFQTGTAAIDGLAHTILARLAGPAGIGADPVVTCLAGGTAGTVAALSGRATLPAATASPLVTRLPGCAGIAAPAAILGVGRAIDAGPTATELVQLARMVAGAAGQRVRLQVDADHATGRRASRLPSGTPVAGAALAGLALGTVGVGTAGLAGAAAILRPDWAEAVPLLTDLAAGAVGGRAAARRRDTGPLTIFGAARTDTGGVLAGLPAGTGVTARTAIRGVGGRIDACALTTGSAGAAFIGATAAVVAVGLEVDATGMIIDDVGATGFRIAVRGETCGAIVPTKTTIRVHVDGDAAPGATALVGRAGVAAPPAIVRISLKIGAPAAGATGITRKAAGGTGAAVAADCALRFAAFAIATARTRRAAFAGAAYRGPLAVDSAIATIVVVRLQAHAAPLTAGLATGAVRVAVAVGGRRYAARRVGNRGDEEPRRQAPQKPPA
jgi:hypothetical protein